MTPTMAKGVYTQQGVEESQNPLISDALREAPGRRRENARASAAVEDSARTTGRGGPSGRGQREGAEASRSRRKDGGKTDGPVCVTGQRPDPVTAVRFVRASSKARAGSLNSQNPPLDLRCSTFVRREGWSEELWEATFAISTLQPRGDGISVMLVGGSSLAWEGSTP